MKTYKLSISFDCWQGKYKRMIIGINNNHGRYIAQYEAFVTQYNKVDDLMVKGTIKTNDDRRLLLSESVINVIEYYAPILQVNDKLHTHILI